MAAIIGTEGPDVLTETIQVDTIEGLGGDDVIILDKGQTTLERDLIDGGEGSDRLVISRSVAGIEVYAFGPPDSTQTVRAGSYANVKNVEHYTIYHLTGQGTADNIFTGAGDDIYYFTATNNGTPQSEPNQVDLGSGQNDLLSVDGSSVFDFGIEIAPIGGSRSLMWVGSAQRINFINIERLEFIGSALGDRITGLSGNDIIDGRNGNDTIYGMGGNDRLTGGNGDDWLDGGEGDDVLTYTTGSDTTDGGNGTDRLVLDARSVSGSVVLFFGGSPGPTYSGALTYAAGTVSYSGIESFTVHSSTGNFGDHVVTGPGDDVFYHYGRNDPSYSQDAVDLGGGSNDLLVADFSAVTDHAVTLSSDPLPSGHYLFRVGGNGKIDFTGVERIHFIGGAQNDVVFSLAGDDVLVGGAGSDRLYGGDGNDDITGGSSSAGISNELDGGNGDDIFRSFSSGYDRINGGPGFDTAIIDYSDRTDRVQNTGGGDIAYFVLGNASVELTSIERIVITTGSGNDAIVTGGGDDEIRSGAGTDAINGGAGDDYLDGGADGDDMAGLAGDDTYVVDSVFDTIIDDDPAGGTDLVLTGLAAYTLPTGVENLTATNNIAHQFRGNALNNIVSGESGVDTILLQDGGDDTARGFAGNDVIYFGAAYTSADVADGGAGRDAIVLQGNYVVTLGSLTGIESVSLQSGANASFGDTANNFYDFDITTIDSNVAAGQQLIVNAQSLRAGEDFTFDGSAETNGRFLVYGGHGVDNLTGGADVDVFFFEGARFGAGDKVDGGAGRDAIVISGGSGLNHIEFASDALTSIESISVNKQYASDPSQVPSYDFVLSNGNVGPTGTLIVNGSSIPGGGQVVNIDGRAILDGRLILFGSGGHDVIYAGAGNDTLYGGGGQDSLAGGAGADVFRYDSVSESAAGASDLIADFQAFGLDKIDLSRIDANTLAAGDQAFTWIGASAFSGAPGELRVRDSGGYRFVEGDVNGDGVADLSIQFYANAAPQVQADFLL